MYSPFQVQFAAGMSLVRHTKGDSHGVYFTGADTSATFVQRGRIAIGVVNECLVTKRIGVTHQARQHHRTLHGRWIIRHWRAHFGRRAE